MSIELVYIAIAIAAFAIVALVVALVVASKRADAATKQKEREMITKIHGSNGNAAEIEEMLKKRKAEQAED